MSVEIVDLTDVKLKELRINKKNKMKKKSFH